MFANLTHLVKAACAKTATRGLIAAAVLSAVPSLAMADRFDTHRDDRRNARHDDHGGNDNWRRDDRHDDHDGGHGSIGISIDRGPVYAPPPPVYVPCPEERVWVEPVYRTVCDRVWVEPVVQHTCDRVWVAARYEWRDVEHLANGRSYKVPEQVLVEPAHWADVPRDIVIAPGHYEDRPRQELVAAGHWETRPSPVVYAPRHDEGSFARIDLRIPFGH